MMESGGRHGKNKRPDRFVMDLQGEKVTLRPCFFTGLPANYFGSVCKGKKIPPFKVKPGLM